jgi:ABC-2 type transport system ATP-binding protein
MTRVRVAGAADRNDVERVISSLAGVRVIRIEEPGGDGSALFTLESDSYSDIRNVLARTLIKEDIPLLEIYSEELSLEDIFIRLVTSEGDA